MKPAMIYLATALAASMGAPPTAAQTEKAPLTLEQEQIVSGIRDRDREIFISAASEAGLDNRYGFVKPIAKWTQDDYWKFFGHYHEELLYRGTGNPDGTIRGTEAQLSMELLLQFGSGGADGAGGGDGE